MAVLGHHAEGHHAADGHDHAKIQHAHNHGELIKKGSKFYSEVNVKIECEYFWSKIVWQI